MSHRLGRLLLLASTLALPARAARAEDETPRVRSVQPAGAARGSAVDVVVEGKFLHPVEEITSDREDVVVQVVKVGNTPNRLKLHVTIAETAPAGPVKLTIRTKAGTAVTDRFAVRMRTPTVAKVVPAALPRGKEHEVTVHGTHLALPAAETKVTVPEPMTLTRVPKKSDAKTLVVIVVVPPATPLGPRALTIETGDGTASAPFTVVASPPVVTGVEPARVARGTGAAVRISGENLSGASVAIAVPDAAVRLEPAGEPGPTAFGLKVTVDASAAPGPRTLLLATPDGMVATPFEVFVDPPTLTRVVPAGAPRGTGADLVVEGKRIPPGTVPRFVPADPGLRVEARPGVPRLAIDATAVPGPRSLVVALPDGTLVAPFQVTLRPPSVAAATPAEVPAGTPTEVAIEGQNLEGCAWSVVPADPAVSVEALAVGRVRVSATLDARPGPRCLAARNADGVALAIVAVAGSAAVAPVVTSVSPARVTRPGAAVVVVKGVNLLGADGKPPAVRVEGEGGTAVAAEVTSSSSSSLSVSLGLVAETKPGAYVLSVATPGGGAAGVVTVAPSSPAIASVTPANVARAAKVDVALAGAGLLEPSGKPGRVSVARADGTGTLPVEVLDAKPDALRIRLSIPPDHPPGDLLVSVATEDGGAAGVLVVDRAPPVIESVSPRRIGVPTTATLRIEGKNLVNADGKPPLLAVTRPGSPSAIKPVLVEATPTALTLRVTTAPGTLAGPHVASVRTTDGAAAALFEIVDAPPPTVTRIEVDGAAPGGAVLTRILGTGLDGVTEVTFEGAGVTARILPGGTATELHVRVAVDADAARGPRTFTLVAPGGEVGSGKVVFTVR